MNREKIGQEGDFWLIDLASPKLNFDLCFFLLLPIHVRLFRAMTALCKPLHLS